MKGHGPTIVTHLPERQTKLHRGLFLDQIKERVGRSSRPRLIVDLTSSDALKPETIDLLLECVEEVEHADGRVAVAASPETAVVLEVTQLTSVLEMFPSVSEATDSEVADRTPFVLPHLSGAGAEQNAA